MKSHVIPLYTNQRITWRSNQPIPRTQVGGICEAKGQTFMNTLLVNTKLLRVHNNRLTRFIGGTDQGIGTDVYKNGTIFINI